MYSRLNSDGQETKCTLVPTVHVGRERYYEDISEKLNGESEFSRKERVEPIILMELLVSRNLKKPHPSKYTNIASLNAVVTSVAPTPKWLGWVNQLDYLPPTSPNTYVADLDLEDVRGDVRDEGGKEGFKMNNLPTSEDSKFMGLGFFLGGEKFLYKPVRILSALLLPSPEIWVLVLEWVLVTSRVNRSSTPPSTPTSPAGNLLVSIINTAGQGGWGGVYLATTYNIISQGLSAGTVSGVGNRVEERNERLVDAVEEVVDGGERDVRVCYGVMHAEGIDRGMRKKGWRRGEDGTLEVLKLGREEEEEGEDKEGWGFPALPRTQAALKAGPVPVAAAFAYLAVGGADYAEAVGMAGEGRWPEIAAYGIRHVLMYYGLGKVLNYDS